MASTNDDGLPFTFTSGVDTSVYASLFSKPSNMPENGLGPSLSPEQLSISASIASMMANRPTPPIDSSSPAGSTPVSTTLTRSTTRPDSSSPTTSAAPVNTGNSEPSATALNSDADSSSAAVATSAANNADNALQKQEGAMSSPGMQAAVAVPVVVVVLAVIALILFCIRRRKKRNAENAATETEKAPITGNKQKWTRHFRIFSFDNELLMGGRFSATNSIRSRQTESLRSGNRSQVSGSPSLHSVEEVAPPYRDAISTAQHPNIAATMAAGTTGAAAAVAGVNRSASSATAPPPYGAAAGRLATPSSATRSTRDNPFLDIQSPVSPVEGSPFNDPPGTTPTISRNPSLYTSDRDDMSSIGEAASIREATLARNASVMSGGRVIDNVSRHGSQ